MTGVQACAEMILVPVTIQPRLPVSLFAGYRKEKRSLIILDGYVNLKDSSGNLHFWCRGFCVNTVGANTKAVARYAKIDDKDVMIA